MGGLTFMLDQLSNIPENPVLGVLQRLLVILLFPGMISAMALSQNVHTWHLQVAALMNAVLYFVVGWFALRIATRGASVKGALVLAAIAMGSSVSHAQKTEVEMFESAQRSYISGNWDQAEKGFRDITRSQPNNVPAQMYLGQTLFHQQKYPDAVAPYEKVRSLEKGGVKLTLTQHRILVDQLAMAYGISGRTADSKALLQEGVRSDPDYPLNYYNLACVSADENDKLAVLKNLTLAFQHRRQVLPGEQMPDPASDPSFQKYAQDADFKALVGRLKG